MRLKLTMSRMRRNKKEDDDVDVFVEVADIVESGSDILRCCRSLSFVVVASMTIGVDVGWLGEVNFIGVDEVELVVCAVDCVSVSICICEVCWLTDCVFEKAEYDCVVVEHCWLNGEVKVGESFWSSSFSGD